MDPAHERDEGAVARFVERFAAALTEAGLPRMAARGRPAPVRPPANRSTKRATRPSSRSCAGSTVRTILPTTKDR